MITRISWPVLPVYALTLLSLACDGTDPSEQVEQVEQDSGNAEVEANDAANDEAEASSSATGDEDDSTSGSEASSESGDNSDVASGDEENDGSETDAESTDGDGSTEGDESGDTDDGSESTEGGSDDDETGDDGDSGSTADTGDDPDIADVMPASYHPPGGLAADEVPLFVVLGFDDNRFADGMQWVLDLLEGRDNPKGNGQTATFDGAPVNAAFYHTSNALDSGGDELLKTWLEARDRGYEVANHTVTHADTPKQNGVEWADEIPPCSDALVEKLEINRQDIWGFRAPFLSYDRALFEFLHELDEIVYDCSVMHIPDDHGADGFNPFSYVWPYTLDEDLHLPSTQLSMGRYPGLWMIPVYNLPMAEGGYPHMAGFDSSVFSQQKTGPDFFNMMRWALDMRLEPGSNRAPLTIGLHSDLYTADNTHAEDIYPKAPFSARRKALQDFLNYALEQPDVRFVSAKQLMVWMSNPVALR